MLNTRRKLSSSEINEVEKFRGWVEDRANNFSSEQKRRFLAILKTKWPECVDDKRTSDDCKSIIEYEIANTNLFTENDKLITVHVLHIRSEVDDLYNAVVIRTNEVTGRVAGVYNDGMVYYDFPWNGTGVEATEEEQKAIPPVNGLEVQGSTIDKFMVDPTAEARKLDTPEDAFATPGETSTQETASNEVITTAESRKLRGEIVTKSNNNILFDSSLLSRRHLAQKYSRNELIAGGNYHLNYTDANQASDKLDTFLATPVPLEPTAGSRSIGPWDCRGLTGVSCCAMIKHSVRDHDEQDNAVQCWVETISGLLTVKTCEDDLSKICIYETYDGKVFSVPLLAYDKVLEAANTAGTHDITLTP